MLVNKNRKKIQIIWLIITIIGVFAMVFFTVLPAFGQ